MNSILAFWITDYNFKTINLFCKKVSKLKNKEFRWDSQLKKKTKLCYQSINSSSLILIIKISNQSVCYHINRRLLRLTNWLTQFFTNCAFIKINTKNCDPKQIFWGRKKKMCQVICILGDNFHRNKKYWKRNHG